MLSEGKEVMADIECTIETRGAIRGWPKPTDKQTAQAVALIDKLKYSQMWKTGTIDKKELVRLDGQKTPGNLQVQINDTSRKPRAGTTLAGVLVHDKLRDFGRTEDAKAREKIEKRVREALKKSLRDGKNYFVRLKS
jgi:hypothetical protein